MPYYCEECGEEENFRGWQDYTESGNEEIFFDSEGSITDYGDRENEDSDSGEWHDLKCGECDCEITWCDEDELEELKITTKRRLTKEKKAENNWKDRLKI